MRILALILCLVWGQAWATDWYACLASAGAWETTSGDLAEERAIRD